MTDCRSFEAFPTSSGSSGLCAWTPVADPYVRVLYRRLSAFQLSGPLPVPLPASEAGASSAWWAVGSRLSDPVLPRPEPLPNPTFPSLSCVRSSDLLRLAPPGVYLEGSRFPLESPSDGTTGFAEPGLGDVLRTSGASGSVFGPPPLPSGGSAVRLVGFL